MILYIQELSLEVNTRLIIHFYMTVRSSLTAHSRSHACLPAGALENIDHSVISFQLLETGSFRC